MNEDSERYASGPASNGQDPSTLLKQTSVFIKSNFINLHRLSFVSGAFEKFRVSEVGWLWRFVYSPTWLWLS